MKTAVPLVWLVVAAFVVTGQQAAHAQHRSSSSASPDTTSAEQVRVFLDCQDGCDEQYIRRNIPFVSYVRDRQTAEVHLFITEQRTGSGGRRYNIEYIGQEGFSSRDYTLDFTSPSTDTREEERRGLVETLKVGLVPYVAESDLISDLSVSYEAPQQEQTAPVSDPWNSWVFEVNLNGNLNLESQQKSYSVYSAVSADRVTEAWRVESRAYTDYDADFYERDTTTISSSSQRSGINGEVVKSISDHWSAGVFSGAYSNSYRNTELGIYGAPAVEYNVYPYAESSEREFTFTYRLGISHQNYIDSTIFNRLSQRLVQQTLEMNLEIEQPWGGVDLGMQGQNYFHDFSKNSLNLSGSVSLRVFKGLSMRGYMRAELINDQLYLAKGDASLEEILLRRRQLATSYEVRGGLGLSYEFGSIYNNVVNTRL